MFDKGAKENTWTCEGKATDWNIVRSFVICNLYQIKEHKMGRKCGMNRG